MPSFRCRLGGGETVGRVTIDVGAREEQLGRGARLAGDSGNCTKLRVVGWTPGEDLPFSDFYVDAGLLRPAVAAAARCACQDDRATLKNWRGFTAALQDLTGDGGRVAPPRSLLAARHGASNRMSWKKLLHELGS